MRKGFDSPIKNRYMVEFESLDDMVETIKKDSDTVSKRTRQMSSDGGKFSGVRTMKEAFDRAQIGTPGVAEQAMEIANQKVSTLERDIDMPAFASYYDVSGADVDVARFLSGEPENMINYHMVDTPRAGRIISIAVSVCCPGFTKTSQIKERGLQMVALVLAIEKIGFQVELWTDFLTKERSWGDDPGKSIRTRTRLKAPGELLDPGVLAFALCDPAYFRALGFAACHQAPQDYQEDIGIGSSYGQASMGKELAEEYPEGTVYVPSFYGDDADAKLNDQVTQQLRDLGII